MDWNQFNRGVFLVNVLGVVYDPETKRILIGRRENDLYVKELSWCFPGGRPGYDDTLENYLKHEVKIKTGVEVEVRSLVLARIPKENAEFMLLYYLCYPIGGTAQAGEKFVEINWIKPLEINSYFKTSIDERLLKLFAELG